MIAYLWSLAGAIIANARYEANAAPVASGWSLVGTPTNVTINTALTGLNNGHGVEIRATSTTATPRAVLYKKTGTSIAMRIHGKATSAGTVAGGPAIALRRSSDGKFILIHGGPSNVAGQTYQGYLATPFTDINTIGTPFGNRVGPSSGANDQWVRLRVSAADTVKFEGSADGETDWFQIGSDISVTAQIGAGDPDEVCIGGVTADTSATHTWIFDRGATS